MDSNASDRLIPAPSNRLEHLVFGTADQADIDAVSTVFWQSRRNAMPWLNDRMTPVQIRAWMRTAVFRDCKVLVARMGTKPVAFAAVSHRHLPHLYVHPDHQRHGVGSTLLQQVMQRMPGGFDLWVFQRNVQAAAFYEKHGLECVEKTDGRANREREPDMRWVWHGKAKGLS
jgi:ribosomal protein S18 acetylase RimI-like enzyme